MAAAIGISVGIAAKPKPNPEMIKLLRNHGADINQKGQFQSTPLHLAAWFGDLDTIKLLIELGADPSIKSGGQETAAEIARANKHEAIAVYLEALPNK